MGSILYLRKKVTEGCSVVLILNLDGIQRETKIQRNKEKERRGYRRITEQRGYREKRNKVQRNCALYISGTDTNY